MKTTKIKHRLYMKFSATNVNRHPSRTRLPFHCSCSRFNSLKYMPPSYMFNLRVSWIYSSQRDRIYRVKISHSFFQEMEVRARAPGKIILAGEHAVVHGSTAVAASIDLYTYVTLGFPTPSGNYLSSEFLSFHC